MGVGGGAQPSRSGPVEGSVADSGAVTEGFLSGPEGVSLSLLTAKIVIK